MLVGVRFLAEAGHWSLWQLVALVGWRTAALQILTRRWRGSAGEFTSAAVVERRAGWRGVAAEKNLQKNVS